MAGKCLSYTSIIAIGLILLCQHSDLWAEEEHVVELPIIFSLEGTEVNTSACLRVREKVYDIDSSPWDSFRSQARTSPETDLVETIAAMVNKDNARLMELSHSRLGNDPQKFQKQAFSYFNQFSILEVGDVWGYFSFGDLKVFFIQINFKGTSGIIDFPFAREEAGNLGFLPYKTDSLALKLVRDWFNSDWGSTKGQAAVYCQQSLLERVTHKVMLDNGEHTKDSLPELLVIGRNLADTDKSEQPYASLRDKIWALKNALMARNMDKYFDGLTERGKKSVKDWYSGAQEEERRKYIESFLVQEPFYVFNADPLFVVYSRTGPSGIQVLYFVRDKKGQFLWANAAYGTTIDRIFKSKRFLDAANKKKPFDSWRMAKS